MKTRIKAILFDIDDTLYDRAKSQPMVLDKIMSMLPGVFKGLSRAQALDAFLESDRISTEDWEAGRHMEDIRDYRSKLFLKALGLSLDYAPQITEAYVREYPFINAPVDGAVELVAKASRRFKTGVISNSMPDVQHQKIKTLGLTRYFDCVVIATEIGLKKPDPAIFAYAARHLQLAVQECLYIGDNYENDVMGAKGAGMRACWLRRKNVYPENPAVKADFTACSLKEIESILESL
jgi:putative hydrolase of the HAD superfamily